MAFQERAKFVCPKTFNLYEFDEWTTISVGEDEPCVRSEKLRIALPEVIVLSDFNKTVSRKVPFTRQNLYKRDAYTCQYCGTQPGSKNLSIDHVVPKSKGGISTWTNCVLSCLKCNHKKGDRTLKESGMQLRRQPEAPKWDLMIPPDPALIKKSWLQFIPAKYQKQLVQ
jgi:5-methylcytosine-specific restriction endonuclease McrA